MRRTGQAPYRRRPVNSALGLRFPHVDTPRQLPQDSQGSDLRAEGDFASVRPLLPATKQLEYSADGYLYRDVYAGMNFFVGQELVYHEEAPIWGMVYSGGVLIDATGAALAEIYRFLREALRSAPSELPVRGPRSRRSGQLTYLCRVEGDLECFDGAESIEIAGSVVYELRFSGGSLK